ncbi:NAD(P)-binding protein [Acetobacter lambici]|uniref:Tryptophan 2-monooxygenase n=1 Tax=Acetobacter lambici TaxID=1332824 RepID=A0ABT1F1G2_9PROT|nr:flavin monoamine oxidase family protein [Acetobacter lambici]MCP1242685.1 flavin monoamine oxidase family protein [Acetobacter lambici]MCP1258826.1 flavin monoamine oxidase family protein [Acetobacter lambici]NHO57135.1 NAD(P)-binding protein [Acetobacter lambici]
MAGPSHAPLQTRRQLLGRIGTLAGSAALYQAMTSMGHAMGTDFSGPPNLSGAKPGTSVLVLGAGLAGMLSAYELRKAGYDVQVLEFQTRSGGRNISLRGGDTVAELGGATQKVGFAAGNYLNPGPWRIPYHHQALLHYCREFGVQLEPFIELNHNSWLHSTGFFGGKVVRYRELAADFTGFTAELLAKAVDQHKLDDLVSADEVAYLKNAMRGWGALTPDLQYTKGTLSSLRRGFEKPQGGGPDGAPVPSELMNRDEIWKSGMWNWMAFHERLDMQTTMFQPVGGMDSIGKAFARQLPGLIHLNCKVTAIHQDNSGVSVTYNDMGHSGAVRHARADYCVCTIPLSILSQLDVQVSDGMKAAIAAVPYGSSVKLGLEFKRRFWEEDDKIYGGISFTNQPISQVSYPSHGIFSKGPAVLLGGYMFGPAAYDFAGMTPQERLEKGIKQGLAFHPQYRKEFLNGVSYAWSRTPWTLGCCALWSEEARKTHYQALCAVDQRVVLAGEHASYVGCWQEGAVLSALDAVTRLHKRALGAA